MQVDPRLARIDQGEEAWTGWNSEWNVSFGSAESGSLVLSSVTQASDVHLLICSPIYYQQITDQNTVVLITQNNITSFPDVCIN
jgi:hypothetical protein